MYHVFGFILFLYILTQKNVYNSYKLSINAYNSYKYSSKIKLLSSSEQPLIVKKKVSVLESFLRKKFKQNGKTY